MATAVEPRMNRLAAWKYAATTTNPPAGLIDAVTLWIVVTRAAVLPMTLFASAVAGLLAVGHPGFNGLDLALAVVGITAAHLANNLMNDRRREVVRHPGSSGCSGQWERSIRCLRHRGGPGVRRNRGRCACCRSATDTASS